MVILSLLTSYFPFYFLFPILFFKITDKGFITVLIQTIKLVSFFIMIICTEKRIIGSLWGISVGGGGWQTLSTPSKLDHFKPPLPPPPHPIPTPHIQPKQQTINYKKSNYCNTPNQPFMCRLRLCQQRLCRHNFEFVVIELKTGFICKLSKKAIIRYYNCCCFFGKLHNFLKSGKFVNFITVIMNIDD